MKTGRIPKKLFVVAKPPVEYKVKVDGREFTHEVRPAFAVDGEHDKMIATAKSWGTDGGGWRGPRYEEKDLTFFDELNEPYTNLLLIDLEKRSEGGCAYKVLDAGGHLYDLREDVFLECLYAGEIEKRAGSPASPETPMGDGVYLTGKFIWGVNGSQMRLVRVGSKLYEQLKTAGERRKMVTFKKSELIPGHVYRMRGGEERAYLGSARGKGMLIVDLSWDKKKSFQERMDPMLEKLSWNVRYTRSCAFVEDVGTVVVPADIFERYDKELERQKSQERYRV
jgi:hypothetical protein